MTNLAAERSTRSSARDILALEALGADHFAAGPGEVNHIGTLFGGRLVGQALACAVMTVDDLPPSSLHAYFLAPTDPMRPIEYRVTRLRDSRRFANRQVIGLQGDIAVFILQCQFHDPEAGFAHQAAMPDVPPPEDVALLADFVRDHRYRLEPAAVRNFLAPLPVELRPIAPERYFFQRPETAARDYWFRLPSAADIDDDRLQACLLAYASDYWLAGVSAVPHIFPTNAAGLLIASLDHSIWFHGPARCDGWLLHHTYSPSAHDGLGLAQGMIFDRTGRLVATSTQECLLRRLDGGSEG